MIVTDTAAVIARIEKGDLFRKLSTYVINRAGSQNCIVDQGTLSHWLASQAKPMLSELKKKLAVEQMVKAAHEEFGIALEHQMETVAPHIQQLNALYQKHMEAHATTLAQDPGVT